MACRKIGPRVDQNHTSHHTVRNFPLPVMIAPVVPWRQDVLRWTPSVPNSQLDLGVKVEEPVNAAAESCRNL